LLRDKLGFLTSVADPGGPPTRLRIGADTYLLSSPEDVGHVLVRNSRNYEKTPRLTSSRGRRLSGKGVLTSSGDEHARLRRLMQPLFHRRAIARFSDLIVANTDEMLDGWPEGGTVDVAGEMMSLVRRNVLQAVFGTAQSDLRILEQALATRRRYIAHVFGSLVPLPEYLPTPINLRYRLAMRTIDRTIYQQIAVRRRNGSPPEDLLAMLMEAQDQEGRTMSDAELRDEALTLSLTGYETLGEALAWTLYLLAVNPEEQSALVEEMDRVIGAGPPQPADLPQLHRARMVFAESLRLYPPTWIFIRMARGEDHLPSGAAIPPGAKLYLCPYVMHRNPLFFPDPERFDPDRFSHEARRGRPRFAYFPFGAGPRTCIGESLARMEAVLCVVTVLRRFRLELVPGQAVVPQAGITLGPRDGIRMRASRR
jgi:cytochrome P450